MKQLIFIKHKDPFKGRQTLPVNVNWKIIHNK